MRSNGARAYGTGRRPLLTFCPARVLIDDFHHIRHLTAPPPPRFVCLGAPLATCALPKGVCYLLTYLLTHTKSRGSASRGRTRAAGGPQPLATQATPQG